MTQLPYIDGQQIREILTWKLAVEGIETALRTDVDPENDSERLFSPTPHGEYLIMPAVAPQTMGVKVLTVAPENPAVGLEKIQGVYLLFDTETSAPIGLLDGVSLTAIRTPAVTIAGLRALAASAPASSRLPESPHVLVFGVGIQGINHIRAMQWAWPDARFSVVGRRPERIQQLISTLAEDGIAVEDSTANPDAAVREADVIITATSSTTPVFDGADVRADALVASVGQHGLHARELDAELIRRSDIVLESRGAMYREGGNIIPARSVAEWQELNPVNLREAVRGEFTRTESKPAIYTGVGMAWEDLVLAQVVFDKYRSLAS